MGGTGQDELGRDDASAARAVGSPQLQRLRAPRRCKDLSDPLRAQGLTRCRVVLCTADAVLPLKADEQAATSTCDGFCVRQVSGAVAIGPERHGEWLPIQRVQWARECAPDGRRSALEN
eukprot:CAMPEP_0181208146 /NCGR_PEP_ID=MMETSP1096-20121128/21967_1 /TAXON_ID=156174 ORGANISM="Chrysochromulina ericina, Strain CCMP281" /NCGR_SAMPLE_ID=MMETSP1096 /ASSEMBLY_ACC=CAM_ASM_000453 /LENGTH=118 /DNA_ID=CAMNT_0023299201 /DNA_START=525 /DNA_END=879 /DNA_ORIENTATION=+